MTRIEALIPLVDVDGNFIDSSSLQSNLEGLAIGGLTTASQFSRYSGGEFLDQCNGFTWTVQDSDVSAATGFYSDFVGNITFQHAPTLHTWTLAS